LTYEADGLVSKAAGDWSSAEVDVVEPSPAVSGSLATEVGGEFATGAVSPEVESACAGVAAVLPVAALGSAAATPGAGDFGTEPEPEPAPEPPEEPAEAAADESLPWTTAPLLPGFPTRTSTFTFFGLSWLELADALAFPV
jgi:hypothetical protein